MKASILVYNGADELDMIGPYRVLQHATKLGAELDLAITEKAGHGRRAPEDTA